MNLLQELLSLKKLNEHTYSEHFDDVDLWLGRSAKADMIDSADVEVHYEYAPSTPGDHPAVIVTGVTLQHEVSRYDDDENVIGKYEKGTDLSKLSWWQKDWSDWLAQKIN